MNGLALKRKQIADPNHIIWKRASLDYLVSRKWGRGEGFFKKNKNKRIGERKLDLSLL